MGSSLRDIPGAGGGRRRGRLGRVTPGPGSTPWRPPPKITAPAARSGPALRLRAPRVRIDRFNLLLGLAFLTVFVVGGIWLWRANGVTVASEGLQEGDAVTVREAPDLEIPVTVRPAARMSTATVRFEGEDVTDDVDLTDDGFVWHAPDGLEEGTYHLEVDVPRAVFGTARWTLTFGVDSTPPVLEADTPAPVAIGEPVTVRGHVDEAVDLVAEDREVAVTEGGDFSVTFERPPAGAADLQATDRAGNVATFSVPIAVAPPQTHGVHLSPAAWNDDGLRDGVLGLLDGGRIDTVVLDLKDECGIVTYGSEVDLAGRMGAVDEQFDLEDAVAAIHDHGGRVVGRLVVFRDPMLARWAWANGHPDWVLQDTANDPWPAYGDGEGCPEATNAPMIVGGFANVASQAVWDYVTDLAAEAASLGVDDVLLDDVRRPDADLTYLQAVGLRGTITDALTEFLRQAQDRVRDEGAYLGATLASASVRDPALYDQDPATMAAGVDYLAPEVFPSSYADGYFNLPSPEADPGGAVRGALTEAGEHLGDAPTPFIPWLQDFTSSVPYGAAEVQAQVDAAGAVGSCSWVLEDPEATFEEGVRAAC